MIRHEEFYQQKEEMKKQYYKLKTNVSKIYYQLKSLKKSMKEVYLLGRKNCDCMGLKIVGGVLYKKERRKIEFLIVEGSD